MSNTLFKFIKENHVEIKELTWTKKWSTNLYEFSASYEEKGQKLIGHGTSTHRKEAFYKAFFELVERRAQVLNNIKSSNAMAAHYHKDKVKSFAKKELIERHIYFKGHKEGRAISYIELKNINVSPALKELQRKLENHHIEIFAFHIGSFDKYQCVQMVAYDKRENTGLTIGLGCEKVLSKSIEKAMIECFRKMTWVIEKKHKSVMNLKLFMNLKKHTHDDHKELGLCPDYARNYLRFLISRVRDVCFDFSFESSINYKFLSHHLSHSNLLICKAVGDSFEDVYLGSFRGEFIPHCLS